MKLQLSPRLRLVAKLFFLLAQIALVVIWSRSDLDFVYRAF